MTLNGKMSVPGFAFAADSLTPPLSLHTRPCGNRAAPAEVRPVLGIMCCNEFADRPVQAVSTRFLPPLAKLSGVSALIIPAMADCADIEALSQRLDGLLLTGSRSNVAGHRYGRAQARGPADEQRDEVALSLAGRMIERGRPVFGICRGFQELNVLFGGTLCDLDDGCHRAPAGPTDRYEDLFAHQHEVKLAERGRLAEASGLSRRRVSSVHEQGIDRLAAGLVVEAVATDDGLVEAFSAEGTGADILAVQWHPEIAAEQCPVNSAFYALIGQSLRRTAPETARAA